VVLETLHHLQVVAHFSGNQWIIDIDQQLLVGTGDHFNALDLRDIILVIFEVRYCFLLIPLSTPC
jgi:hypothetical protein